MKLPLARRITTDNVPPEQQATVETLSYILNPFIEDVTTILNGQLDYYDNLISKIVQFEVMVDSTGKPLSETLVNPNMQRSPYGAICVNVQNADNINSPVDISGQPFAITQVVGSGMIKIDKILNLKQNQKYILTLLFL